MTSAKSDQSDVALTADFIQSSGGFIDRNPIKKRIKWERSDGEVFRFDVFIRRQSFVDFHSLMKKYTKDGDSRALAQLIASSVARDDFSQHNLLTVEQAEALDPGLGLALLNAVNDVQAPQKKAQTKQKARKSTRKSGTNSSSPESVVEL